MYYTKKVLNLLPFQKHIVIRIFILEEIINRGGYSMWFSPLGNYLTYVEFDDTDVDEINFPYYGALTDQYPEIITIPYPKVS